MNGKPGHPQNHAVPDHRTPTEAGERLPRTVGPRFEEVEGDLAALNELRQKPTRTIRITAGDHPAVTLLWPKLSKVPAKYSDVKVEINMERGLIDIAAERFDAGVRLGEQVAKDMVSVRIGLDVRFAVMPTHGATGLEIAGDSGPGRWKPGNYV